MFPYLFSAGSEANVKQCVLFVPGRPTVYLLFISIIRNKTCTFRISVCILYNLIIYYFGPQNSSLFRKRPGNSANIAIIANNAKKPITNKLNL